MLLLRWTTKRPLRSWVTGWLSLAEGLVLVGSLGLIRPQWVFSYVMWTLTRDSRRGDK